MKTKRKITYHNVRIQELSHEREATSIASAVNAIDFAGYGSRDEWMDKKHWRITVDGTELTVEEATRRYCPTLAQLDWEEDRRASGFGRRARYYTVHKGVELVHSVDAEGKHSLTVAGQLRPWEPSAFAGEITGQATAQ